jgi:hypothetical protein
LVEGGSEGGLGVDPEEEHVVEVASQKQRLKTGGNLEMFCLSLILRRK